VGTNLTNGADMATGTLEFDGDNTAYVLMAGVAEMEGLEPETIEEAWKQLDWVKWEEAVNTALRSLHEVRTWNIVRRLAKTNVISCKWVFKIKKNAAGEIDKYKAWLVVCSFMQ